MQKCIFLSRDAELNTSKGSLIVLVYLFFFLLVEDVVEMPSFKVTHATHDLGTQTLRHGNVEIDYKLGFWVIAYLSRIGR